MNIETWKKRAKGLKGEILALYLAFKDPRTPWYAKALSAVIISYALSPIDLIPDFIPFLGYLDDLILIPAGITLLVRMIPKEVLEECREKARTQAMGRKPRSWVAAIIIVFLWLLAIYLTFKVLWRACKR
jgi:uncharacterized membrane protein YkvA (DUF1232 family)